MGVPQIHRSWLANVGPVDGSNRQQSAAIAFYKLYIYMAVRYYTSTHITVVTRIFISIHIRKIDEKKRRKKVVLLGN